MLRAIWPDSFVEEIGLARNISVLRKLLGEDPGEQQFIETVPKRGYRFKAQVREHVDDAPGAVGFLPAVLDKAADRITSGTDAGASNGAELVFEQSSVSQTVEIYREYATNEPAAVAASRAAEVVTADLAAAALPTTASSTPLWKSKRGVVFIAIAVVGLIAALWFLNANRNRPIDKLKIKSIAVLPFKRLDSADDSERLGMGMTDTLITRLSNIRELTIRPTRDVMRYENAEGDIADAAKALDVDAILDGSIQRGGDLLRVTVRLIHTETKSQIWAAQFDEKLTDVFTMQDAISAQVAKSLS